MLVALTLSLTLLTASFEAGDAVCNPATSKSDIRIKLVDKPNGTCYFPFVDDDGKVYNDCKEYNERWWCPTTCNYQQNRGEWSYCRFTFVHLGYRNCQDLPRAKQSKVPSTYWSHGPDGRLCVFPYRNYEECEYDCERSADHQWGCSTITEASHKVMLAGNVRMCNYRLIDIAPNYCKQLNSTKEQYLVPFSEKYSPSNETDPNGNCTFPFSYNDKCYDDCVPNIDNVFQIWCSTEKYNIATRRWRYCPHYRKYKDITDMTLRWGYYRIRFSSSNCGKDLAAFCNATVVPVGCVGSRRLALSQKNESQIWEILPQPNNFFIVRSAFDCRSVPLAWSLENGKPSVESLSKDREFWGIDAVPGSAGGEFRIRASDPIVREQLLRPWLIDDSAVLGLWYHSFEHTSFRIEKISDYEIAQQQAACEQSNADTMEDTETMEGCSTTEGFRTTESFRTTEGFNSPSPAPNEGSRYALIIILVAMCVACLLVLAAVAFCFRARRKKIRKKSKNEANN